MFYYQVLLIILLHYLKSSPLDQLYIGIQTIIVIEFSK